VLAVIRGSAVTQDGRTNGIAVPNPDAQIETLRNAYASAGIDPKRDRGAADSAGLFGKRSTPPQISFAISNAARCSALAASQRWKPASTFAVRASPWRRAIQAAASAQAAADGTRV